MILCPISVFYLRWNWPFVRSSVGSVCIDMSTFMCLYVCVSAYLCMCACVSVNAFLCACSTEKQSMGRGKALLWRPTPRNVCSCFALHFPSMWEEPCLVFGFTKCWHSRDGCVYSSELKGNNWGRCILSHLVLRDLCQRDELSLFPGEPTPQPWSAFLCPFSS